MRRVGAIAALGVVGLLLAARPMHAADDESSAGTGGASEAAPAPEATPKGKWSHHGQHGQHHGRHHHDQQGSNGASTNGGGEPSSGSGSGGSSDN